MFKILDDEFNIGKTCQRFVTEFQQSGGEKINVRVGYHGGHVECKISWYGELGIWMHSEIIPGDRLWNAFGIGRPVGGENVSIICEINFPLKGIDRQVAGAFVTDNVGSVLVVHRGKIGGGRKGIGKTLFQDNYRGQWISVEDGDVGTDVALVGALNSPRFTRQVSQFVHEVGRIKSLVLADRPPAHIAHQAQGFRDEFAGRKRYTIGKQVEAQCDHGLIVGGLACILSSRGLKVGNDRRDLYIVGSTGNITTIFEIKTDTSTTSLYTALGQLMLYSVDLPVRPRLVLVVPQRVEEILEARLNKLGIELLTYEWSGDKAVFAGLSR